VLAVDLLNSITPPFRPTASLRTFVMYLNVPTRGVGTHHYSTEPDPASFFALDAGEPKAVTIGNRYDNVLPVPVG